MTKAIRYTAFIFIIVFAAYHSVYFKKLDEIQQEDQLFDAGHFSATFWADVLPSRLDSAALLSDLIPQLASHPDETFQKYAHSLSIGNVGYFAVRGEGRVIKRHENFLEVILSPNGTTIDITTEFIVGNAIRDAFRAVADDSLSNIADINRISEALNESARQSISQSLPNIVEGSSIRFFGAMEMNKTHPALQRPEIIPVTLNLTEP